MCVCMFIRTCTYVQIHRETTTGKMVTDEDRKPAAKKENSENDSWYVRTYVHVNDSMYCVNHVHYLRMYFLIQQILCTVFTPMQTQKNKR